MLNAERHDVFVVGKYIVKVDAERAACLAGEIGKKTEDGIAALIGTAERSRSRDVPNNVVCEHVREGSKIAFRKGVIAAACEFDVRMFCQC
jgi:hypothetical protein